MKKLRFCNFIIRKFKSCHIIIRKFRFCNFIIRIFRFYKVNYFSKFKCIDQWVQAWCLNIYQKIQALQLHHKKIQKLPLHHENSGFATSSSENSVFPKLTTFQNSSVLNSGYKLGFWIFIRKIKFCNFIIRKFTNCHFIIRKFRLCNFIIRKLRIYKVNYFSKIKCIKQWVQAWFFEYLSETSSFATSSSEIVKLPLHHQKIKVVQLHHQKNLVLQSWLLFKIQVYWSGYKLGWNIYQKIQVLKVHHPKIQKLQLHHQKIQVLQLDNRKIRFYQVTYFSIF